MKAIYSLIALAMAAMAVGCSKSAATAQEETPAAMTVDELLAEAPALTDSVVTVEGVCTHTCRHGATKMFLIGSDDTKTIRVEACELGSFKPEVVNSLVTVKGVLRETRIDEGYLAQWEQMLEEQQGEKHGEAGTGCETERAARGVQSTQASEQIAEYRQRIAENVENGLNPWISYYFIEAQEYEIEE